MRAEELQSLCFLCAIGALFVWKGLEYVITKAGGPSWLALAIMLASGTVQLGLFVRRRIRARTAPPSTPVHIGVQ